MNDATDTPPLAAELHACADGRLAPARQAAVEAWLAEHPESAVEVNDWRRQKELLHTAFDPVLEESVPERLAVTVAARRRPPLPLLRIAAGVGWLAIGVIIGFALHGKPAVEAPAIVRQAAIAHAVYTPEVRHPVEVGAEQEAHLLQWLSKRLGTPLRAPQLAGIGYALVGGRLLPGERGPVAQFMYEDAAGRRLTLYVRSGEDAGETAFRYAREGKVSVFYWVDGRLGYALSGDLPRAELLTIAEAAYRQLAP